MIAAQLFSWAKGPFGCRTGVAEISTIEGNSDVRLQCQMGEVLSVHNEETGNTVHWNYDRAVIQDGEIQVFIYKVDSSLPHLKGAELHILND